MVDKVKETRKMKKVKTVVRAIRILESIGGRGDMGVSEISQELGFPKSSTFEVLSTLQAEGLVTKDPDRNTYRLGLKLFELGNLAQDEIEIRDLASPLMKSLNQELDETVHLTILDDMEVLYIECFESTKRLRTYSVIGVRAPLHCTAVGKAIMAHMDGETVERIMHVKGLKRFTGNTITTREDLLADLRATAERGYATDIMEHEDGLCCVGAPIRDHTGRVFASMSVSGPSQRVHAETIPRMAAAVMSRTKQISLLAGYRE